MPTPTKEYLVEIRVLAKVTASNSSESKKSGSKLAKLLVKTRIDDTIKAIPISACFCSSRMVKRDIFAEQERLNNESTSD